MKAIILTAVLLLMFTSGAIGAEHVGSVKPIDEWNCPKSHPIKGNVNPQKGTMIYHLPGGQFYNKTKPERCFATEEDARAEGFRRSKR